MFSCSPRQRAHGIRWLTNPASLQQSAEHYGFSIMFSKLSVLVLFLRYMPQKPTMTIYATMVVVILYSLIGSFGWVFSCQPIEKFWDLRVTRGSCIEWTKLQIFTGVMNTATDAIILILPIFLLRRVRLPKWEKIGLSVILMTGGLCASYPKKT
jgi:hypothetical protein